MARSLFTKTVWNSTEPLLKTDKERKVLKREVTITCELSPGNLCLKVEGLNLSLKIWMNLEKNMQTDKAQNTQKVLLTIKLQKFLLNLTFKLSLNIVSRDSFTHLKLLSLKSLTANLHCWKWIRELKTQFWFWSQF